MPSLALKASINYPFIAANSSPLLTGLIDYWNLDTAWPSSLPGGYSLGVSGTVSLVSGIIGNAATFSGSSYLFAPSNIAHDCSISCWFKSSNGTGADIGVGTGFPDGFRILSIDSDIYFQSPDASVATSAGTTVNYCDGLWHHVVGVSSSGNMSLWIDGALIDSNTNNNAESVKPNILIGNGSDFDAQAGCIIDEVGIWGRGLTYIEVAGLYNSGNGITYPF